MRNKIYLSIVTLFIIGLIITSCKKDETEKAKATSIDLVAGNHQSAEVRHKLANLIEVQVKDQFDKPFKNEVVSFLEV